MVSVQKRGIRISGQEATVIVTIPLPVALLGLTVTHGQGLLAVQEHPGNALTFTVTLPPNRWKSPLEGLIA